MIGQLLLVRHGQTEWAAGGRHTGRTDVPLTEQGEREARELRGWAASLGSVPVLCSPLQRARHTAELAGFQRAAELDPDLLEWDYGGYEGLTTPQIRERTGQPDWQVFTHGVVAGDTPGETLEEVAARARRVIGRVEPLMTHSDIVLVAHAHVLRVLAACWLLAEPIFGQHLLLDPATVSVLGVERDVRVVHRWNTRFTRPD
jgi:probable phosphoglycerate mutase